MWSGWRFGIKIAGYGSLGQTIASAILNGPYGKYLQVIGPEGVDFDRDIAVLIFNTAASKQVSLVVDDLIKARPDGVGILLFPIGGEDDLGDDYLSLRSSCKNAESVLLFDGLWEEAKTATTAAHTQIIALVEAFAAAGEFDELCDFDFCDFQYLDKQGSLSGFVNFFVSEPAACFEDFCLALDAEQWTKERCPVAYVCIRARDIDIKKLNDTQRWVKSILNPQELLLSIVLDPLIASGSIQVSSLIYRQRNAS